MSSDKCAYAGVDVGGTNLRVAVWSAAEERPSMVASGALPSDYEAFLAFVGRSIDRQVTAAAVALPGRVDDGVAAWVPNVTYLEGRELARDLAERTAAPVRLANDGQMALLGEARFGVARGAQDALLVTVGTGIGGAVMRRGRLVRGANGTAGSFGWLSLGEAAEAGDYVARGAFLDARHGDSLDAVSETTSQLGPWEAAASGRALDRHAALLDPPLSAATLLPSSKAGHEGACRLLERFARQLGAGLASLASLFDPELVVVSGGVADLVRELLPEIRLAFQANASPSVRHTPVRVSELRQAAGAFGAAVFAKEGDEVYLG